MVTDDSDPFTDLDSDMNDDIQASADSELSSLICQLQRLLPTFTFRE